MKVNWGRGVECLFSEGISLNGGAPVHLELDMLMVAIDCEPPGLYAGLDQQVIEGLVAVIVQVVGIHPLSWGGGWRLVGWWVMEQPKVSLPGEPQANNSCEVDLADREEIL